MGEENRATSALGLHREGDQVKAVLLSGSRSLLSVRCLQLFRCKWIEHEGGFNPLSSSQQGKELLAVASKELIVTGIDPQQLLVRRLELQLKKEKDIEEVLQFQAEPLLPFPLDEGYLARTKVAETAEGVRLTLQAVRRDDLELHISHWHGCAIEPELVASVAHALATFLGLDRQARDEVELAFHFSVDQGCLALVHKGKLLAAQPLKMGWQMLLEAHRRDRRKVDLEGSLASEELLEIDFTALEAGGNPHLQEAFLQLQRELLRLSLGLYKQESISHRGRFFLTGELAQQVSFGKALAAGLGHLLTWIDPPESLALSKEEAHSYAIPVGLALTALPVESAQIDFRQGEMAYPHPWRRLRFAIASTLFLCLVAAASLWAFGSSYLDWKEESLRKDYLQLLETLQKDYGEVEKGMGGVSTLHSPSELTASQIADRLRSIEQEMAKAPVSIALFPNVPRVSDLLVWLATHPLLVAEAAPEAGETRSRLRIDGLNYKMVKRPDQNKPREKYQVQVEMEISSDSAKQARLFYDSLVAPNDMIDTRSEVKWTATGGKYRFSFFLKDKTVYP